MDRLPKLQMHNLTPSSPLAGNQSPIDITSPGGTERRAKLFPALQKRHNPHDFRYFWSFYHDKASSNSSDTYENRLTLLQDDIINPKLFWQVMNNFPFQALRIKDSVHFFKRGVKPVWEDSRNLKGGAWTFRIPKDKSEEFFREILLMAVGEQFADVIQPGDDLCGISLSVRFNSNLISIWHRRGDNKASMDGILHIVQDQIADELKPLCVSKNYYYKLHSEHVGFSEMVAKAREADQLLDGGKIPEADAVEEAEESQGGVENAQCKEAAAMGMTV